MSATLIDTNVLAWSAERPEKPRVLSLSAHRRSLGGDEEQALSQISGVAMP